MDPARELYELELALARRDEAAIPGGYEAVIDEAFVEFGSSGRRWERDEILELLTSEPRTDAVRIEAFEAFEIGQGVVLVNYETVGLEPSGGPTLRRRRSSLWLRADDGYRLRFHQGTPVPQD